MKPFRYLLLIAALAGYPLKATDITVNAIGAGGDLPPDTAVVVHLDLHGISAVSVWANGVALGALGHPYDCHFTTLSAGQTNTLVVEACDYIRVTTTNIYTMVSRARTYNKRAR